MERCDGYKFKNFALFSFSENIHSDSEIEQLTQWSSFEKTKKMKDNWFEKDRNTFILAEIIIDEKFTSN